jgi:hypothetical protein
LKGVASPISPLFEDTWQVSMHRIMGLYEASLRDPIRNFVSQQQEKTKTEKKNWFCHNKEREEQNLMDSDDEHIPLRITGFLDFVHHPEF